MIKRRIEYLGLILGLLVFVSCQRQSLQMPEIVFPPVLYSQSDCTKLLFNDLGGKNCLKLITTVDGDCGACLLTLLTWGNYLRDFEKNYEGVTFAAIINTQNILLLEYNLEQAKLKVPFYIDTLNMFYQSNNLSDEQLYTLLLDKDNNVIYNHSPFENKREHRKIVRLIKRYRDRNKE